MACGRPVAAACLFVKVIGAKSPDGSENFGTDFGFVANHQSRRLTRAGSSHGGFEVSDSVIKCLKIPLNGFKTSLAAVLRGEVATLRLRKKVVGSKVLLLSDGAWKFGAPPEPRKLPPFSSFVVLSASRIGTLSDASSGQTLISLVVSTARPNEIEAIVHEDGTSRRLDQLKLIGAGLINLTRSELQPATEQNENLIRITGIQGPTRRSWAESSHVVVGAGSGGSCLAGQLTAQAPSSLILVDEDIVQRHNLINLPNATPSDAMLKRRKAKVQAAALNRQSPELVISAISQRIQEVEVQDYLIRRDPTAIWSFVDDPAAHLSCALICRELLIPHIAVGTLVSRSGADVSQQCDIRLLLPGEGCARCVPWMPDDQYESALYEVRRPRGCLRRGPRRAWNEGGRIGSSLSLNHLAAALAVQLFSRLLEGTVATSTWLRYLTGPGGKGELLESPVAPDPRCRICSA